MILDGRNSFYQWDLNQKLIILDDSITEVHFCNKTDDCALVCEVYKDGNLTLVNVPNILLQDDWSINAYAVAADHTEHCKCFKVISRSKPADYVYTETEIKTFSLLEMRMDELESNVSAEGIAQAVEDYLTANPVEAGATAEERAQIEQNTKDIIALGNEKLNKKGDTLQGNLNLQGSIIIPTNGSAGIRDNTDMPILRYENVDGEHSLRIGQTGARIRMYSSERPKYNGNDIALKSEIPSVEGLASTEYVDNAVNGIEIPSVPSNVSAFTNDSGYQTAAQVKAIVDSELGVIENGTY